MGRVTQNFIVRLKAFCLIGTGALALAACTAAVPDAEKALSAASRKPDGVYGISPVTLQLRASNKTNFSNINVYSSVAGVQTPLTTNFNTGYITGLTANTTYALKVHGVSPGGVEATEPMNEYYTRTWIPFASSTWNLSENSRDAVNGSIFRLTWAYAPWMTTAAGDGAYENTGVRCYFVPSAQPDPFVGGAKIVDALLREGGLDISSAAIGLNGFVRVGCEVHYIDGTTSRHLTTRMVNFAPAVSACPAADVTVYDAAAPYSCLTTQVGGATIDNTYSLQLDASNTCGFVQPSGNDLSGAPYASDLDLTPSQTCNLAYRLTGPGFTSDVLNTTITVKNVQPQWEAFPTTKTIREISPNDPALPLLAANVVDLAALVNASSGSPLEAYRLVVNDADVTTSKERQGVNLNRQFGRYFLDSTTSTSCAKFGLVGHADAGAAIGVATGIDPKTGAFVFLPYNHFFGSCTVDMFFDDGQVANHRSDTRTLNIVVEGYNDPPRLTPPTRPACDGGACFVGIDYDLGLSADVGGINLSLTSLNESANQELFLKPGNCISTNETYLKVNYCQLDENKNLLLSFTPMAKPPTGVSVGIQMRVSDNGNNSMISARYPVTAGNSPANSCLLGHDCGGPFPDTNRDSATVTIPVPIDEFNLPIRPALIVSKAACIACHARIDGDFITDYGNSGTGSRFRNMFFKDDPTVSADNGWFTNRASHFSGTPSIDLLTGSFFTKRAKIKHDVGGVVNQSKFLNDVTWVDASNVTHAAGSMAEINLVDFLRGNGFNSPSNATGWQTSYVSVGCASGSCTKPTVSDQLPNGDTIEFLRIDAPTANDIQTIARQASPGSEAYKISWNTGGADWATTDPAFGATYLIPTSSAVEPRPFLGLVITTKQPFETIQNNQQARNVPAYVRNSGVIECYGDVVVKGNLFLSVPRFKTDSRGCRIHVTGDVIFHAYNGAGGSPGIGMYVESPGNAYGVQITSASSVSFGLGQLQLGGELRAMPFSARAFAANIGVPYGDECYTPGGTVLPRGSACVAPNAAMSAASSDHINYPAGLDGWDHGVINYSKLMVNAPVINSRYLGEMKGSVIADYALFRLGQLQFTFDPVFQGQVPFPRLQTVQPNPRVIFNAGLCAKYPKECVNGSN